MKPAQASRRGFDGGRRRFGIPFGFPLSRAALPGGSCPTLTWRQPRGLQSHSLHQQGPAGVFMCPHGLFTDTRPGINQRLWEVSDLGRIIWEEHVPHSTVSSGKHPSEGCKNNPRCLPPRQALRHSCLPHLGTHRTLMGTLGPAAPGVAQTRHRHRQRGQPPSTEG